MNKNLAITKKQTKKNKGQVPDLKPKKDPKGGIIAILIRMGAKKQSPTLQ
ncbi:MAG TPA: hypothetical protein VNX27_11360 [Chthoniobacterales bacterium]|jgi:hypothetical protein|nr:hypothetical protein [Chthoniobacterales bacterium]